MVDWVRRSDRTTVCLTGDQLGALLSQATNYNTPTSVPSSRPTIREPEATTTPRDLTNSGRADDANWTAEENQGTDHVPY
jgi:hypothetical protein